MKRYLWPWSLGWLFVMTVNAPQTKTYKAMKTVLARTVSLQQE